jgi:hypothetical protein
MIRTLHVTLLLLLVLTTSCGTLNNINRPELLTAENLTGGKGVVLLSTGAPRRNIITAIMLMLVSQNADGSSHEIRLFSVDNGYVKSDFTDRYGLLHAIALPPGRYYLTPWLAHPAYIATYSPRFEFVIAAGEITYLGEYRLTRYTSAMTPEGLGLETGGDFEDQSARDLPLFAARNPRLDVSVQLPTLAAQ